MPGIWALTRSSDTPLTFTGQRGIFALTKSAAPWGRHAGPPVGTCGAALSSLVARPQVSLESPAPHVPRVHTPGHLCWRGAPFLDNVFLVFPYVKPTFLGGPDLVPEGFPDHHGPLRRLPAMLRAHSVTHRHSQPDPPRTPPRIFLIFVRL